MNLKTISSDELISKTKTLAAEERKITAEILHYLQEIDHRRAYLEHGCTSLWDFCRKVLLYSEGAAQRRIQSMRLLREIPELKSAVEAGSLNLMTLAKAKSVVLPKAEKKEFILSLQNKSTREVEREVKAVMPEPIPKEKERSLDGRHIEIKMVISEELREKLELLKDRLGKKISGKINPTHSELLEYLVNQELEKTPPSPPAVAVPKTVTPKTKAYLIHQAQNRCSYVDPKTGKQCENRRGLEIDHRHPQALGGDNRITNLRVLCKTHNLYAAQALLGDALMDQYWRKP